ncbi:MAG: SDR family oxidoreductase [Anaerolineae bacterium]|nr:SDR family oxidoreductase [Anaerolineae bacterium]
MANNGKGLQGLQGKVAIVTGASSGIGRATALAFAREGVKVAVSDVNVKGGQETVRLIEQQGGEAIFVKCDVSSAAEAKALVEETVAAYGRLDFACNNAGIGGEANLTADYSLEGWNKVIAVNLTGVFLGMKYQIPEMIRQGGGAIVNMASILGHVGFATAPAYVSAKHGVIGLTKNAAIEYAKQNIRVTAVCPAFIHTPLVDDGLPAEVKEHLAMAHPIGRMGSPEEVAELVVFLCSDGATFMTGNPILADGL